MTLRPPLAPLWMLRLMLLTPTACDAVIGLGPQPVPPGDVSSGGGGGALSASEASASEASASIATATGAGGESSAASSGSGNQGGGPTLGSYEEEVLRDVPDVYLRLDDEGGATAVARVGPDGTFVSVVATGQPGAIPSDPDNDAVVLSGGCIDLGDIYDRDAAARYSLEAWVKWDGPDGDSFARIFSKESGDRDAHQGIVVFLTDRADAAAARYRDGSALTVVGSTLATRGWRHLVVTFDGFGLFIYLDGARVQTTSEGKVLDLVDTEVPFRIGCRPDGANRFFGAIDEVALYPDALTPERIAAHHAAAQAD